MLHSSHIGNASARSAALGQVDRIELGLAHMVNSARLASRKPSSATLALLIEDVSDFIRSQPCDVPPHWLRNTTSDYRRIELWRDVTLGCQILAVVWPPGARTPIHDHAGAWGIEAVWAGNLQITEFQISASTRDAVRLNMVRDRNWRAGELLSFMPPSDIHLCRNPSTHSAAVSIHVYADALQRMTTFESVEQDWYRLSQRVLHSELT